MLVKFSRTKIILNSKAAFLQETLRQRHSWFYYQLFVGLFWSSPREAVIKQAVTAGCLLKRFLFFFVKIEFYSHWMRWVQIRIPIGGFFICTYIHITYITIRCFSSFLNQNVLTSKFSKINIHNIKIQFFSTYSALCELYLKIEKKI